MLLEDTVENNLTSSINQTIASGITWDGTPPSSTKTEIMSWQKIGKYVFVDIRLEYASAGSANTQVTIDIPVGMPLPLDLGGVADGEIITAGQGRGYTTNMQAAGTVASAGVYKASAAASGYRLILKGLGSIAAIGAAGAFQYPII